MRPNSLVAPLVAAVATAHVVMNTPTPYGLNSAPLLQVNPLDGNTYKFPCQYGTDASAYPKAETTTALTAGSTTPLNFTGTAVHAGGSCQLSVTYDWPPPADKSKWKVIHSIIGGCPVTAAGNLVDSAANTDEHGRFYPPKYCEGASGPECMKQYDVPVPKQLKNGKATLAWTWLNKIGNREFYMNCAPVTVSGGSDDDAFTNGLPDMFVANIPGECTTGEGVPEYPNPGDSVEISKAEGDAVSKGALGACETASGSGSAETANGSPGSKTAASKPNSGSLSPTAAMNTLSPSAPQPSSIAEPATPEAIYPATSSSISYSSTDIPTTSPTPASPSPTACTPCTGALTCLSHTTFALCDGQGCAAAAMDVAAGTQCVGGQIVAAAAAAGGKDRRSEVGSLMTREMQGRAGVKMGYVRRGVHGGARRGRRGYWRG